MVDSEGDAIDDLGDRPATIPPLAIIADDLTGCCDTAAPFATPDQPVAAFVAQPSCTSNLAALPVIACCTATRHARADEAARTVEQLCRSLTAVGTWSFLKKVDSTWKGNLGAEIEATLLGTSATIAVVCPSLPEQGRMIESATLRVAGDPRSAWHLPTRLARQTTLPQREFRREALAALLADDDITPSAAAEIWIMDAVNVEDLHRVARIIDRLGTQAIAVGSSGLARALRDIGWTRPLPAHSPANATATPASPAAAPLAIIVGTDNRVTHEQLDHLQTVHGLTRIESCRSQEMRRACVGEETLVFQHQWNDTSDRCLEAFLEALQDEQPRTLLLSGGDTAQHVCQLVQASRLDVCGELESGVPWGRFADGPLAGWQWITKAGGFGGPKTLSRCFQRLAAFCEPNPASSPPR